MPVSNRRCIFVEETVPKGTQAGADIDINIQTEIGHLIGSYTTTWRVGAVIHLFGRQLQVIFTILG
jgi:hypothetical protein